MGCPWTVVTRHDRSHRGETCFPAWGQQRRRAGRAGVPMSGSVGCGPHGRAWVGQPRPQSPAATRANSAAVPRAPARGLVGCQAQGVGKQSEPDPGQSPPAPPHLPLPEAVSSHSAARGLSASHFPPWAAVPMVSPPVVSPPSRLGGSRPSGSPALPGPTRKVLSTPSGSGKGVRRKPRARCSGGCRFLRVTERPSVHVCHEAMRLRRARYIPHSALTEGEVAAAKPSGAVARGGCVATGREGLRDSSDSVLSEPGWRRGRT